MQEENIRFGERRVSGCAMKAAARSVFSVMGVMSLAAAVFAGPACGQCVINETAKILASDGAEHDWFGASVAIGDGVLVIGARADDDNGSASGSAYVYCQHGVEWVLEHKLLAPDGMDDDYFGWAVAMDGSVMVIGAQGDDDNGESSGSAYIFRFDGLEWSTEAKLIASDGAPEDRFGASVAIEGDVAIVGAPGDYSDSPIPGAAYIFRFDGSDWVEDSKIVPTDGAAGDRFGVSVALEGDAALIGAAEADVSGIEDCGSAYVYRDKGTGWIKEARLVASDPDENDEFGFDVAVDGSRALVGAHRRGSGLPGAAYLFGYDGSSWIEEIIFVPSDHWEPYHAGRSVALDDNVAALFSQIRDDDGYDSEAVYLFRFDGTTWGEETLLVPSDGFADDDAAWGDVSMSHDVLVAGLYWTDGYVDQSGAVYLVEGVEAAIEDCEQEPSVPEYNVVDLGTLGGAACYPQAINDAGQIVGYSDDASWVTHAFLWEDGEMTDLGGLPGYTESYAADINIHGQIVGYCLLGGKRVYWRATLWDDDQIIDLGTLGGEDSRAYGINDNGRIVGWADNDEGQVRAFMYVNNEMMDIGREWPDMGSYATAVNGPGAIAGWVWVEYPFGGYICGTADAFCNDLGDITMLWDVSPGVDSQFRATDINAEGTVVGIPRWGFYMDCNGWEENAWRWSAGSGEWLPPPGVDYYQSWAYGINDSADIVGGAAEFSKGARIAVRWRGDDGANLDDLIPEGADVQLRMAYAINNPGQIVCIDDYERGFLLNPNVYGDVNGDLVVDIDDIFAVLAAWGPCEACPEDVNGDGVVNIDDLFEVLANWT